MPGGETGHHGEAYLRTACPPVKSLVGARLNVVMNKPHGIPTGVGDVVIFTRMKFFVKRSGAIGCVRLSGLHIFRRRNIQLSSKVFNFG